MTQKTSRPVKLTWLHETDDRIKSKQRRIAPRVCVINAKRLKRSTLTIGTARHLLEIRNLREETVKAKLLEKEAGSRLC
jgi:hypothetical protein